MSLRASEYEALLAVGTSAGMAAHAHAPLAAMTFGLEQVWSSTALMLNIAAHLTRVPSPRGAKTRISSYFFGFSGLGSRCKVVSEQNLAKKD